MPRLVLTVLAVLGLAGFARADAPPEPFAVVELFGSQGCSSCPPADRLLSQITAEARAQRRRVYTLSFQVDYWDYLGWKDPFSNPAFTRRQQDYAAALGTNVYTPEMVVNGRTAFVGSNAAKARRAIDAALKAPAAGRLDITLGRDGRRLSVAYAAPGAAPGARLVSALVERGLESRVLSGENAGRTLVNDNVVRVLDERAASASGSFAMDLPSAWTAASRGSVVAFIQGQDMGISAAAAADVPMGSAPR